MLLGAPHDGVAPPVAAVERVRYQTSPHPARVPTTAGLGGYVGGVVGPRLEAPSGAQELLHVTKPYEQGSREWKPEATVTRLAGGRTIGGDEVVVMAGPCSVESERQILESARLVREADAAVLRAGAYK